MKTICIAVVLLFFSNIISSQTFTVTKNDSTIMTEYNDGKLWAYRNADNFVVGLTCYEEKDDYGKYYQAQILIRNLGDSAVTFCPENVSAYLERRNDTMELEVYTNEEFQKKIKRTQTWAMILTGVSAGLNASSAAYSTSYSTTYSPSGYAYTTVTRHYDANAAYQANLASTNQMIALGKMMDNDRKVKEQGYLKKTTIYPNEAIIGYMNIKKKKGDVLTVNIPIQQYVYSFSWLVKAKKKA